MREELSRRVAVEFVPLPPHEEHEREWRELEERSDGSFFVSWTWVGCWIESLGGRIELRLLRARLDGRTVGLGVFAVCREWRNGLVFSRSLRLHATGHPEVDIVTVECNGFLVERGLQDAVGSRMFAYLIEREKGWDELVLDGFWCMPSWLVGGDRAHAHVSTHANHYVDLAAVRAKGGDYLALLGSKTRSRIRRSCKEYEQFGALGVQCASDVTEAMGFLEGLKVLHQAYWVSRGQPGSFAYSFFDEFHRRLVRTAFARGEIQLLAFHAGERTLGYIYNFVYRGRIYNYQSGLNYELSGKHNRPGLVAHAHAIEYNAGCGHGFYDFLGGDVEYKQALGTGAGTLSWVVVQRNRLRFRIEKAARTLRGRLRRAKQVPDP